MTQPFPVLEALLRPETYDHPADQLRLHETHISWVALAGAHAYKLKKPVNFGFLDFSTYEQRLTDCSEEVRLNRRLCPDVYQGVTYMVERGGSLHMGGAGRAVEPAVWMRRLPEEGMLPAMLRRHEVDGPLVKRIARRLARFHATANTGGGVDEFGTPAAIARNWQENFDQTAPFIEQTLPAFVRAQVVSYIAQFLNTNGPLLERRVCGGRIREGHGDLHAASICVEGWRLHLFDCLEFSARFRCADVAAEVAFLAMDLEHFGRADLASAFVRAYIEASEDAELSGLLDFYTCYRAFVRGKVDSLRLVEPDVSQAEASAVSEAARAYFDLAWAHAGGLERRLLIAVMGLPASGKTTLAGALAGRFGLVHLSSDRVRKELAGVRATERSAHAAGQGLYAPAMTRRTYTTLRRRAARHLRAGQPVVLDATFGNRAERDALQRLAQRTGARLVVLVCQAAEDTLRMRLAARDNEPVTVSDARLALWPVLQRAYTAPLELAAAVDIDMTGPLSKAIERAQRAMAVAISPTDGDRM